MINPMYHASPLMPGLPSAEAATLNVTLDGVKSGDGLAHRAVRPRGGVSQGSTRQPALRPAERQNHVGMIPQEGWGLSSKSKVSGKSAFKDAAVTLAETGSAVTIHLNY